MPELPEVENVTRNLRKIIQPPAKILGWEFRRKDLRFPLDQKNLKNTVGLKIKSIQRRAKYILLKLENQSVLIFHLGMTGHWRVRALREPLRKHDHVILKFSNAVELVYEDPRRFGFIEICLEENLPERFQNLGVEPLDVNIDWQQLTNQFRKLQAPIKSALMDQKKIVGVGNIYASEALFRAGINPLKKCSEISPKTYACLWEEVKKVLKLAIKKGGSTISSFQNSYGEKGKFQNNFFVYGREGKHCRCCDSATIKQVQIAGRSTFWCPSCQRS